MRTDPWKPGERFDWLVLVASLSIIQTPVLLSAVLGPGPIRLVRILCLLPFWAVIVRHLIAEPLLSTGGLLRVRRINRVLLALLGLFFAQIVLAYVRGYGAGTIDAVEMLRHIFELGTLTLFGLTLALKGLAPSTPPAQIPYKLGLGVILALLVYVGLNVLLYASGAAPDRYALLFSQNLGDSRLLAFFGLSVNRVLFPMADGIISFGGVGGGAFVAGAVMAFHTRSPNYRVFGALGALSGLAVIALTDSRVVLLSAVMTALACTALPMWLLRYTALLPALAPLVPFVLLTFAGQVSTSLNPELVAQIARGSSDISDLNSRRFIWEAAFLHLSAYPFAQTIGYGIYGQTASMLYQAYGAYFFAFGNVDSISLHNYTLQYIFDIGVIGLVTFSALVMLTLLVWTGRIRTAHGWVARAMTGMIVFLVLSGSTGVDLTPYHRETFLIVILGVCMALPRIAVTRERVVSLPDPQGLSSLAGTTQDYA